MPYSVTWASTARQDAADYYLYLKRTWPAKTRAEYRHNMKQTLKLLAATPYACTRPVGKLSRCRVDRHISLYCTIEESTVYIAFFQHAARDPARLET